MTPIEEVEYEEMLATYENRHVSCFIQKQFAEGFKGRAVSGLELVAMSDVVVDPYRNVIIKSRYDLLDMMREKFKI